MELLLLTENILVEEKLQSAFQQLGHEIFVSKSLLNDMEKANELKFDGCIISNTVSKGYSEIIINKFFQRGIRVGFKSEETEHSLTTKETRLKEEPIIFREGDSLEVLNGKVECLCETLQHKIFYETKNNLKLSRNEEKVFTLLSSNMKTIFSRHEVCELIWREGNLSSNLSQLSSIVKRINRKISNTNNNLVIKTVWGKVYYCDFEDEK